MEYMIPRCIDIDAYYAAAMSLFLAVILSLIVVVVNQITKDNYGPYDIVYEKMATCKGPKQGNCGDFYLDNIHNMSDLIFNFNIVKDCPLTKARITIAHNLGNNTVRKLWNYDIDSPCKHFVMGPILLDIVKVSSSCKVNKGPLSVHLNRNAILKSFLGRSFFYGSYRFKVIIYNKNNNFQCTESALSIIKKEN